MPRESRPRRPAKRYQSTIPSQKYGTPDSPVSQDMQQDIPSSGGPPNNLHQRYHLSTKYSSKLEDEERANIWDILEKNMRDMYEKSSFGWYPGAKRKELFNRLAKFVLVRSDDPRTQGLIAFGSCRFLREGGEKVLYCFEIQVSSAFRRQGLGKMLMDQMVAIGIDRGVQKMVLTVFKANMAAVEFYKALGFVVDEDYTTEPVDYAVMVKSF